MIFTKCDCGETIVVEWELGMKRGYYRTDCEKCGKIAMTELTSLGGDTTILNDEGELQNFIKEKELTPPQA